MDNLKQANRLELIARRLAYAAYGVDNLGLWLAIPDAATLAETLETPKEDGTFGEFLSYLRRELEMAKWYESDRITNNYGEK